MFSVMKHLARAAKLRCSFCGKTEDEVDQLIAGPQVFICNECIDLCQKIMEEERKSRPRE